MNMEIERIILFFGGVSGLLSAIAVIYKSQIEARKSGADANHTTVGTATDTVELVRSGYRERIEEMDAKLSRLIVQREEDRCTYEGRIKALDSKVAELTALREEDRKANAVLTRQLSDIRRRAEDQSQEIRVWTTRVDDQSQEIQTWRKRVEGEIEQTHVRNVRIDELLSILRQHTEIPLPEWAQDYGQQGEKHG